MTADLSRHAGVLVPLFAIPSTRSWGIGEIPDILSLATWLDAAGLDVLQLLPLNEMPVHEQSPYSALSAMAIDPQFIALGDQQDFVAAGGEAALSPADRQALEEARSSPRIRYDLVRPVKRRALLASFAAFKSRELESQTSRAHALYTFIADEAWWLEDYTLFRALRDRHQDRPWWEWEAPLRDRDPAALRAARRELADEVLFYAYVQWLAQTAWQHVRAALDRLAILGDFPFMVGGDSADVWKHQDSFDFNASVGVPPDAFSETGQDWAMPVYRWDRHAAADYAWLRDRIRRSAQLYDGYRIDHLVGFYRTYSRPKGERRGAFTPPDEAAQLAQGERLMALFAAESGVQVIAEDLGVVPDFVRQSIARIGLPGYRVLRWERHWPTEGQPFVAPAEYPVNGVATTGTHDTEPLAVWWENAPAGERAALLELPGLQAVRGRATESPGLSPELRDAVLEMLFASGSRHLILPIQDVFGWRDRINEPGTGSDHNWIYRLPWPVDAMMEQEAARERAATLRRWSQKFHRADREQAETRREREK